MMILYMYTYGYNIITYGMINHIAHANKCEYYILMSKSVCWFGKIQIRMKPGTLVDLE